jgi:hypothetical protein
VHQGAQRPDGGAVEGPHQQNRIGRPGVVVAVEDRGGDLAQGTAGAGAVPAQLVQGGVVIDPQTAGDHPAGLLDEEPGADHPTDLCAAPPQAGRGDVGHCPRRLVSRSRKSRTSDMLSPTG